MQRLERKLVFLLMVSVLGPVALLLCVLFVYDPLALFHSPWGRSATVHGNMRLHAVGEIRRGEFDSVILGSSVLENSSADEASHVLGGKFVNLSISAGDFFERGLMLQQLLERQSVHQVIYSLDFIYLNQRKGYRVFPLETYDFLYDANPFNDFRVYLNTHFLGCMLRWSNSTDCVGRSTTLDRPNAWMNQPEYAQRFGGFDAWCRAGGDYQIRDIYEKLSSAVNTIRAGVHETQADDQTARAIDYLENNLVKWVKKYPGTRFHVVFPPYYRAKLAIWYQSSPGDAQAHVAVIRYLAALSEALPNLYVYGFEDQEFPDDIAHYKDMDHFNTRISTLITNAIGQGSHRIRPVNVENYIADAERLGRAFRLDALTEKLAPCLETQGGQP